MDRSRLATAIVEIILAVSLLIGLSTYKLHKKIDSFSAQVATLSSRPAPLRSVPVSLDDDGILGSEDAPVTIIEFTDYECYFSIRHFQETFPQIHDLYIEPGDVRLVIRDFPGKSRPLAHKAAEAAGCAGRQGDFRGMHFKLFENQGNLSVENIKAWAREIGLDGPTFDECLDSGVMIEEVRNDVTDGMAYGLSGTPVFFVNGVMIPGARPFGVFEAAIQKGPEEAAVKQPNRQVRGAGAVDRQLRPPLVLHLGRGMDMV